MINLVNFIIEINREEIDLREVSPSKIAHRLQIFINIFRSFLRK